MRFVSHIRSLTVQTVGSKTHPTPYGDVIVDQEGHLAEFNQNDLTNADLEFAEEVFEKTGKLHGRTTGIDEVTLTPLIDRISVYDTEQQAQREEWHGKTYKDLRTGVEIDFKTHVENVLSERAKTSDDFKQVVEIPPAPPWPNYLEFRGSLQDLLDRLVEDGYDLTDVLRFEEKVAHRETVIAALHNLIEERARATAGMEQVSA